MGELEEKETPPAETTSQHQDSVDEPKETDKMLDKKDEPAANNESSSKDKAAGSPSTEQKKKTSSKPSSPVDEKNKPTTKKSTPPTTPKAANGGDEVINIPEAQSKADEAAAEGDEKKMSTEDREVKPKKIPIGGLKLPGFFMKTKPRADGDGADGELLEKDNKEEVAAEGDAAAKQQASKPKDEKPRNSFGERLRNFFVRKTSAEKQKQAAAAAAAATADADAKSEATAEAAPVADEAPPQKRGLLNAIKLPIANMIPKKKSDDDVEMGLGKAGLASMETLDDSLKDQDCVDKAITKNNGNDEISKLKKSTSSEIKPASPDEKIPDEPEPLTFAERLRAYRCSIDDAFIALGILLFILLLGIISYVLLHESVASAPLRQGRLIDAVTTCGLVEGIKEDGAFAFRGIPFALPPIDENRWKPAQRIEGIDDCWNGTMKAHNVSELCTQMDNGTVVGDEDCLYLDVVTPHVRYDKPLPVVVLIGAESLTGPSPGVLRPSPRFARLHHVVFVRPNFRLGAFGFLALDALSKDNKPHNSGNYALSDIIVALEWIQLNIAHFGGDPKMVTVVGHRAGGTLVSALATSKKAKNLFARTWISSASAVFPGKPLEESTQRNQELMNNLKCEDVDCLRSATSADILTATPDTWLHFPADLPSAEENTTSAHHEWLVLDGDILDKHPADSWKQASAEQTQQQQQHPKMVIGANAHEANSAKLRISNANWTAEEVRAFIDASKIGALNLTDEAVSRYNATNYRALVAMITDIRTICPLLVNARAQRNLPFYVVTQGEGADQLVNIDTDVQAILGRYEPSSAEQRRYMQSMQSMFYHYVAQGIVQKYESHRHVQHVGQDALPQEDHANCNYWIDKNLVPHYARVD